MIADSEQLGELRKINGFVPSSKYLNEKEVINHLNKPPATTASSTTTVLYQSLDRVQLSSESTVPNIVPNADVTSVSALLSVKTAFVEMSTKLFNNLEQNLFSHWDSSVMAGFIGVVVFSSGERIFYKQSVDQLLNPLQFLLVELILTGTCLVFVIISMYKLAAGEIT